MGLNRCVMDPFRVGPPANFLGFYLGEITEQSCVVCTALPNAVRILSHYFSFTLFYFHTILREEFPD